MKRIFALLLSLCLSLSLMACGSTGATTQNDGAASAEPVTSVQPETSGEPETPTAADTSAAGSVAAQAASSAPEVALEKVEDVVKAEDGTILVNYEYQKATVTLPDAAAQKAVQDDLDAELKLFLDSVAGETADYAKDAIAYSKEMEETGSTSNAIEFSPYYSQYNVTVERADAAVISLVIDSVGYSGGAHGWDNRYCLNYDSKTGKRLTFDMLGDGFRAKAEKLVLAQAEKAKDELDEEYQKQLPLVVADGTESLDAVNRQMYPELYADASIEPEQGTLNAEFYLNKDGVVFIAGEYVMKAYAVGIMEFPVAYADFGETLNQSYLPQ